MNLLSGPEDIKSDLNVQRLVPEPPLHASRLPFGRDGWTAPHRVHANSHLYINAAASITVGRSSKQIMQVHIDSNEHLFKVFATENTLFVKGNLSLSADKTETKIYILVPENLEYMAAAISKKRSFLHCHALPYMAALHISSQSIARVKATNLFIASSGQPHIEAHLVPAVDSSLAFSFTGDVCVFSKGGGHLIDGTYHNGLFSLAGSAMVSNRSACLQETIVLHPFGASKHNYHNDEFTGKTAHLMRPFKTLGNPDLIKKAHNDMIKALRIKL